MRTTRFVVWLIDLSKMVLVCGLSGFRNIGALFATPIQEQVDTETN